ncbi:CRISPR system Cascade subunit CasA [Allocatelliglobosispora scoriae]|uniref:CRISPR system Cascade subunit CasA n=1 Tax=Allocatelliglobosispora scoriae TaxID=643052 RepID=A0A841BYW8_9ACTN|nr:type I-E CRISPR-associated protein Cse1/CasA [Allocatelliglobosispora scoriae]MBB5874337.1 CRISPR system Cascade subunit CasA [Allocatelliglobosispora scoriae]
MDEPWIPVLDLSGRLREVSLRGLFADAGELRMLACELPTQSFAILRLALAILHRATDGPPGETAWRELWKQPGLPLSDVEDYLAAFRDRFDLLHPERPFYQVADLQTAKGEVFGLERLIADVPNGFPFLTTRAGTGMDRISAAEAARWLLHCQAFDPSGIKSGAVGDARVKGGRGYPIGVGSAGSLGGVYLEGATLRETLLLNLVPTGPGLLASDARDLPVWEREPHGPSEEPATARGPFGVLSLYTWQSRRIRLNGDRHGITGAMVANGDKIEWQDRQLMEPLSVFGRSGPREREAKRVPIYLPRPHDHTRALWRGLETLLPPPASGGSEPPQRLSPLVMQWLARLRVHRVLGDDFTVTSRAVSITYGVQQATTSEVFGDSLTMNVQVVSGEAELRTTVVDSAGDAEEAVKVLRSLAADLVRAAAGQGTDNGAADRAAAAAYAELDRHFRRWLARLGTGSDALAERRAWQRTVLKVVVRLGRDMIAAAGPAAAVGRVERDNGKDVHYCSAQAEAWFRRKIYKALELAFDTSAKEEVPA